MLDGPLEQQGESSDDESWDGISASDDDADSEDEDQDGDDSDDEDFDLEEEARKDRAAGRRVLPTASAAARAATRAGAARQLAAVQPPAHQQLAAVQPAAASASSGDEPEHQGASCTALCAGTGTCVCDLPLACLICAAGCWHLARPLRLLHSLLC